MIRVVIKADEITKIQIRPFSIRVLFTQQVSVGLGVSDL